MGKWRQSKNPLGGDESVLDRFEKGIRGLVLDVFFRHERLAGGIGEAGELVFVRIADDPIGWLEMLELGSFDDEDCGEMMAGIGSCAECFEEGRCVFKTGLELIPIGKEDVLAVGFEGVEFEGNVVEDLIAGAV